MPLMRRIDERLEDAEFPRRRDRSRGFAELLIRRNELTERDNRDGVVIRSISGPQNEDHPRFDGGIKRVAYRSAGPLEVLSQLARD
jgi:hypothetical protein